MCAQLRSAWASTQSDQSLLTTWRKLGSLDTHWTHREDSDHTGWMPRLIRVFAGRTVILLVMSEWSFDAVVLVTFNWTIIIVICIILIWAASSEFDTYCLCEQQRFRRACASAKSRQNLCCSLIQAMSQEEPSDRKPDPWPLWMAGHAQLNFFMTEYSKTQIRPYGNNSDTWVWYPC